MRRCVSNLRILLPVLMINATPAFAEDPDRLDAADWSRIQVAYDRVLQDPAQDPDVLSPAQRATIQLAYDAWDAQDVDRLSPGLWAAMQDSYRSHDPSGVQFAGLAQR